MATCANYKVSRVLAPKSAEFTSPSGIGFCLGFIYLNIVAYVVGFGGDVEVKFC